ncbi:hypothetical protein BJ165DRAFT_1406160 [Panaeolus papilionaceus]|nr:hypothetical protein BJ165DRAFT_1406160 [Panaeolus papilionaceus]
MNASTKFQTSDLANDCCSPRSEGLLISATVRGAAREPPRSDVGKWVRRLKLGGSIHLTDTNASTKFQTSDLANNCCSPRSEGLPISATVRGAAREPPRSDVGKWVRRLKLGGSIHLTDTNASTKFQTSDLANNCCSPRSEGLPISATVRGAAREPPRSDVGKWVGWNRTDEGYKMVPDPDV